MSSTIFSLETFRGIFTCLGLSFPVGIMGGCVQAGQRGARDTVFIIERGESSVLKGQEETRPAH